MARDPIVNQVLMMLMLSATVSAPVQVGLSVTLITTALIPMTTWTIIQRPISAQPLVVLPPRTDVVALRRLDQINIMVTSAHELTQKMQMVPRYRSGGAMYPVFLLGPVLEYLFLAGVPPECMDAADADDAELGGPTVTDVIIVLNWLFLAGAAPAPPSPGAADYAAGACDVDPTPLDGMDCRRTSDKCR